MASKILAEGKQFLSKRMSRSNRRAGSTTSTDSSGFQLNLLQVGSILVASAAIGYYFGKSNIISKKWKQFSGKETDVLNHLIRSRSNNNNNNRNRKRTDFVKGDPNSVRVVCFGDSTTWGYCPDEQIRLEKTRWTKVLEKELNSQTPMSGQQQQQQQNKENNKINYEVISEGLNGRTINQVDETSDKWLRLNLSMNGTDQILPILYTHKPIDLIIIMLGINDCKSHFNPSVTSISNAMETMLKMVKKGEFWRQNKFTDEPMPRVLLLPPIYMRNVSDQSKEWQFDETSLKISQQLPRAYYQLSLKQEFRDFVTFADGNHIMEPGSDSVHLNKEANFKMGTFLAPVVEKILTQSQYGNKNGERDMLHASSTVLTPGQKQE